MERLEAHARSLSLAQPVTSRGGGSRSLSARLAANGEALRLAYRAICQGAAQGHAITPAAEWLIDNYHLVEKQFQEVKSDLPAGYYRQLPTLATGPFAGYPRIFGVAWAFVAHTDSRFDVDMLRRFILAYQEQFPLTIGELWALSITLRIILVENLRRIGDLIVQNRNDRKTADDVANRLLGTQSSKPEPIPAVLHERENAHVSEAFAVQLLLRLRDQDARIIPALTWLEERLAARGMTADEVVSDEHRRQGAATVTVSNIISSLRMISHVDWADLFESMNLVDGVLGRDPDFAGMDFATRNLYRSAIEEIARGSHSSEIAIAEKSVDMGGENGPGHCLIGPCRKQLESAVGYRPNLTNAVRRTARWLGLAGYAGGIGLATAGFLAGALWGLASAGVQPGWLLVAGLLAAIPVSDSAVGLLNCIIAHAIKPHLLPALELRNGVPAELRTLVVVPTLLTSAAAVAEQVENLEVHHLASPEGEVYFALLSDWTDAPAAEMPADAALLAAAMAGIARLNRQYPAGAAGPRFLLLHRARHWNESQRAWIGWERKRGKLEVLNRLLRGRDDHGFLAPGTGTPACPENVRYVVTLDSDTRLPRETVGKLIGKMAHPLNRPVLDAAAGRITRGYGVMQPRVTPSLPLGDAGSLFQFAFSGQAGIDPYAAAVSDTYQDLFDEGSFAGKGIYDVDAFDQALAGRVPESAMLSHDLFEGIFARAAMASDVEVIEDFPERYDVSARRQHRWVRGDWQLLPWIAGMASGGMAASPSAIPAVGRWKMLDNLRRSLSAPMAVLAFTASWFLPGEAGEMWTLLMLAALLTPALIPVLCTSFPVRPGLSMRLHLTGLAIDIGRQVMHSLLSLALLADQAWLMLDAIVRTLYRLFVSRRNMLEWVSHAQVSANSDLTLRYFFTRMAAAVGIGLLTMLTSLAPGHSVNGPGMLLGALWMLSPAIALWVSLPPAQAAVPLKMLRRLLFPVVALFGRADTGSTRNLSPEADFLALRQTARRTWSFFETFVTAADNMLPPDNFQETPAPALARRTSPTNIGLYLLSTVAARDFGWIGLNDALSRLETTLATIQRMEKVRGHLYNWYDTATLEPLEPKYISSVDSGNFAGHLIALARACEEWAGFDTSSLMPFAGISDALGLARAEAGRLSQGGAVVSIAQAQVTRSLEHLQASLARPVTLDENPVPRLRQMREDVSGISEVMRALVRADGENRFGPLLDWVIAIDRSINASLETLEARATDPLASRLKAIANWARTVALETQFGFLLDPKRKLLSIGYLVHEDALDLNCYDLLASEARLASFFAIAKGDVAAKHWFRLGRSVVQVAGRAALISWSGSMFEYLMPSLVMRAPHGSLIEQTSRLIVRRQIEYAAGLGVPWGISESAYNVRDIEQTYQYSNFGVAGLGLKRGLDANLVIAPYASALAAMVDPAAAVKNFRALEGVGGLGSFGFYEALDFTPLRLPEGASVAIVRAYMAHHQGMTIVAIANAVLHARMRARFHAEPIIQATELLLQERSPRDVPVELGQESEMPSAARLQNFELPGGRRLTSASELAPATHLLSNGQYSVMLTSAGAGYSKWRDVAVTRWREDATCDNWGSWIFLREKRTAMVWSAGLQPCGAEPDAYEALLNEDRAVFSRQDGTLTTTMEVLVSAEDNAEVRYVSLVNSGARPREIEITSCMELALAPQAADVAHPVFSKLFVQTQFLPEPEALVATRRRRTAQESEIWAGHLAIVDGETVGPVEIETDRARFIGRGRTIRAPAAMEGSQPLSHTTGTVLDPVFSIRRTVIIAPGGAARIAFWTMVASSAGALHDMIDKHRDKTAFSRAATLAWSQAQVQLHHIGITPADAVLFQRLAGHLIFAGAALRSVSSSIAAGAGAQSGLWGMSISGDVPILLLRIADTDHIDLVRQLLQAHEYWRMKHFRIDLVILNERDASYVQDLQNAIEAMVRTSQSRRQGSADGVFGGVYMVRADLLTRETRALLLSVARAVIVGQRGSIADQLDRVESFAMPPVRAVWPSRNDYPVPAAQPVPKLEFFNGIGGFAEGGQEYVVVLGPGKTTPAPWINVIANPAFGFQVAAEGSGYTWAVNSRENQLTPWSNDPVSDAPGEALYIRDEETGAVWSATASPIRDGNNTYVARHGHGYSRFDHTADNITCSLVQFVPMGDPVKISRLVLHNSGNRERKLSVTAYAEWVLGVSRGTSAAFVVTSRDVSSGALMASNAWTPAFAGRVAFCDMGGRQSEWTCDRREFIGRNGSLAAPAAMKGQSPLAGKTGAGFDPCAALRTHLRLEPGEVKEIIIFLGQAENAALAQALIARYRQTDLNASLREVRSHWEDVLGKVQVQTPDRAMDIMLNGWLLYQTLACRVWARSAFYQASGAYGFRDQLQDGMALVTARPDLTRAHLLRAAGRQFVEGDVQHWWWPNTGQGVRTRITDDRAWLAYATLHYVESTGDRAVLDERVAFLEGQWLAPGEQDSLFMPMTSETSASLYEHCALALDKSLALGSHGLPLMGSGDWNDGMNRVGEGGQGESVWLAWLHCATLPRFAALADGRGEGVRGKSWRKHATRLQKSLENAGWDGLWYRRGYYDDGTPLGSSGSEECQIDAIAQSWSVFSGAGNIAHARTAMESVARELIDREHQLALLFKPPFDKTTHEPGYIKGYPPGIRENGGQYTHGAIWSIIAFAMLGEGERASQMFSMLNPVNHSTTPQQREIYKVEPYVIPADVYAVAPHCGRGGWTWYTGSAGWMLRAGLEYILGLRVLDGSLHLAPCIPPGWPTFTIRFRHGSAMYEVKVFNPHKVCGGIALVQLDGIDMPADSVKIKLLDDGVQHRVTITLGPPAASA